MVKALSEAAPPVTDNKANLSNEVKTMANETRVYWDEYQQRWLVDDHGRPRQATPEEIEASLQEEL